MTEQAPAPEAKAVCPYCGCSFVPAEPGQVYCWPGCEEQHKLEQQRAADG